MSSTLIAEQLLNGLGYGLMLFLLAAGLTLVFGVMDTMNLAHGSLFTMGAYIGATLSLYTGSFVLAVAGAVVGTVLLALALEIALMRRLYVSDHLVQVVATLGVILIVDDVVKATWGAAPIIAGAPQAFSQPIQITSDWAYPSYRVLVLVAGLAVAALLYALVNHTRLGMLVRAGASNRAMAQLMGVRVKQVFTVIFLLGAALAGLAGALMGPLSAVQNGMGETIMIPALIVIVIGGIGSVRGALVGALIVGIVDTLGRAFLKPLLGQVISPPAAEAAGPALASMLIYLLMAVVLALKPAGLFANR
jgi:branched-chain amino acid transport system permease protein